MIIFLGLALPVRCGRGGEQREQEEAQRRHGAPRGHGLGGPGR